MPNDIPSVHEAIASNQDGQPCRTFVGLLHPAICTGAFWCTDGSLCLRSTLLSSHELSSRLQPSDERAQSIWAEYCEAAPALAALGLHRLAIVRDWVEVAV